jgi:hypothetical protein
VCGKFKVSFCISIMTWVYSGCTLLSVVTCRFLLNKLGIFFNLDVGGVTLFLPTAHAILIGRF